MALVALPPEFELNEPGRDDIREHGEVGLHLTARDPRCRKQYGLDDGKRDPQSVSIALSFLIGITSSLITVLLTPRLQHLFWVRQKRFDLRAKNLESLHALLAKIFEYLGPDWATGELTGADSQDRDTKLEDTLAREWRTVADQTRFLFSKEVCHQLAQINNKLPRVLFRRLPDPLENCIKTFLITVRNRTS